MPVAHYRYYSRPMNPSLKKPLFGCLAIHAERQLKASSDRSGASRTIAAPFDLLTFAGAWHATIAALIAETCASGPVANGTARWGW
ncbi:hypothetical protein C8J25_11439 [Sphingomonas faeni]|uniref:Uncharacterized protein n=1 Tax=Sphingomonas faeni TaxID=185950 RepID=A0A2T5TX76_9SPHN|nr:hypothetical protein C8J25_11439 [Sphingomonas faeni]